MHELGTNLSLLLTFKEFPTPSYSDYCAILPKKVHFDRDVAIMEIVSKHPEVYQYLLMLADGKFVLVIFAALNEPLKMAMPFIVATKL